MDAGLKAKWLEALRGFKYVQGRGTLRSPNNTYCCLGVLCDIQGIKLEKLKGNDEKIRNDIYNNLSNLLTKEVSVRLQNDNDDGMSFKEIADWIEANIEGK
jgi:hypothetical protein